MPKIKRLYRAKAYYKKPNGDVYTHTYHFQTKWRRDQWAKERENSNHPFKAADRVEVSDSEPIVFRDDFEELA